MAVSMATALCLSIPMLTSRRVDSYKHTKQMAESPAQVGLMRFHVEKAMEREKKTNAAGRLDG